jgi:hypothetical protein
MGLIVPGLFVLIRHSPPPSLSLSPTLFHIFFLTQLECVVFAILSDVWFNFD